MLTHPLKGDLQVTKQRTLYLRSVFDMGLAFYLEKNGIETQTAIRISAMVLEITHFNTVNTLQSMTLNQVEHIGLYLTADDFKTFKQFHYKYLLEYNKELRQSMQDITKSIEDLHNGNNRLPVVFWNRANAYNVAN